VCTGDNQVLFYFLHLPLTLVSPIASFILEHIRTSSHFHLVRHWSEPPCGGSPLSTLGRTVERGWQAERPPTKLYPLSAIDRALVDDCFDKLTIRDEYGGVTEERNSAFLFLSLDEPYKTASESPM